MQDLDGIMNHLEKVNKHNNDILIKMRVNAQD